MKPLLVLLLATTLATPKSTYMPYEVYVSVQHNMALLEKDKCMSGAYIEDESVYSTIKAFEDYSGVENDIYITKVEKGKDIPIDTISDAYAKGKYPLIRVDGDYGITNSTTLAELLGNMNIALFIEIENCSVSGYNAIASIFREKTPRAVLVYGVDAESVIYSCPNNELVDWIAINSKPKVNNGALASQYENISMLCDYYSSKTVMLNISVPNFSVNGCTYLYKECSDEIDRLYSLPRQYSNIGAINYISEVEREEKTILNNYRITENIILLKAYKNGVEELPDKRYWEKSHYVAYVSNNKVILSNSAIKALNIEANYINSGFSSISVNGFNKSERKVFVKL